MLTLPLSKSGGAGSCSAEGCTSFEIAGSAWTDKPPRLQ
jgi:hypothetical protein